MDETQHSAPHPAPTDAAAPKELAALSPADEPLAIRTAEDILAYIPHALGEWPHESLVVVRLAGGQLGSTLRIDLPGRRGPSALRRFTDTVAEYVAHGGPAAAVLALYTHRAWSDPQRPPHREVVDAVVARLAEEEVQVGEVWVVGEKHWRTATCTDILCCPWPGTSVESLRASRIEAEMVYRGSSYGTRDLLEPVGIPVAPPAAVAAAIEACLQDPERWWDPLVFTAALAAWEDVLSGQAVPDPSRLRLLAATVMRPALRDAVLVASASDAATAWQGSSATAVLRAAQPEGQPPGLPGGVSVATASAALDLWSASPPGFEFGPVLLGSTGSAPAWDRIARLERIALSLAQMEEPEVRAPALSMLAWVQWARGRGGRSLKFLERALSADPDYRLAQLLWDFVQHGQLAGWALNRETAWHRAAEAAEEEVGRCLRAGDEGAAPS
ncbi:DUF4192 domain-containing protein [Sinomonas sp. ASV486]|uniref:DUF4192 domain-containing protein n=1 Tax=Sinomonas sp. ASV486 TaxID=3051170 RepID=UPI0027DB539C|nr:DUF4192 domain-containing protein [Sinomonas sp. ASV486]MDQ4489705.1 DUF4192 domain-containing protein [Sinomonas sp. ASV486]